MSNIGRRGALGIVLETEGTSGITLATPGITSVIDMYIPYLSCGLTEKHTVIADVAAKGIRDTQGTDSVEGKKWGEGAIEVVLEPRSAPYWLGLALGSIHSTTSVSAQLHYHEISRKADNQPLSATIYRDRVVDEVDFPYSVVNALDLNFADDVAKLTVDILSKYPGYASSTPSYVDLELYTFKHAYVELALSGSTSTLTLREFNLSINNNIEMVHSPNDNDVGKMVSKGFDVSGNMVIDFETTVQRDAFRDVEKQSLSVVFTKDTNVITITIPQLRVDALDRETPNDDISKETINFVAEWDADTTSTISIVVQNNVATYGAVLDYIE